MKKRYVLIIIIIVVVVVLLSILLVNNKSNESSISINTVNLDDGLQKEELESLSEDDYRRLNSPDIYNLDLDDVDNTYYYKMVEMPGVYKGNATREEREKIYLYQNDLKAAVLEMCKKDGDWSLIINSDEISGFNQKDGLLAGFNYNSIESGDWAGDDYSGYVDIVAKNDDEERQYRISIYKEGIIQSVIVKLGGVRSSKTNNEIDLNKLKFDIEHVEENFRNLGMYENAYKGGIDWNGEDIGITDKFYEKYPYFLDIFIHYSPLEYNKITLKDLDVESQIAIFEVDSKLECKKRTYEVKYVLDNNQHLDDVEVKLLNESTYAGNRSERTNKVLYKHSNWDSLDLTDDFLSKYSSDNGLLPNIDKIDIDVKIKETYVNPNDYYQYIYNLKTKDNKDIYYFVKFDCDNKGNIDNISFEDLPYDSSMTLEEVRDAYIRDYVEKN